MPDDEDYAELGRLLNDPRSWTGAETAMMRSLLRQQTARLLTVPPLDRRQRAHSQALIDQIASAIRIADVTDRPHPGGSTDPEEPS